MAGEAFDQINKIFAGYQRRNDEAQVVSLLGMMSAMKNRIFQKGQASNNTPMGAYKSAAWKKKRAAKKPHPRRINYKDLEYTGELRKSIQVGTSEGNNVIGFVDPSAGGRDKVTPMRVIAEGQESQIKKEIFTPSDDELDELIETYLQILRG